MMITTIAIAFTLTLPIFIYGENVIIDSTDDNVDLAIVDNDSDSNITAANLFPARRRCRCDQIFRVCGPSCQVSCASLRCPQVCIASNIICRPGCYCRDFLVSNEDGTKCIPPSHCPVCGPNEEYKLIGLQCVRTCECLEQCHSIESKPGCYCKTGYVRNKQGQCVRPIFCSFE